MKATLPMAKILLYDIETSPIISYNWGIWDQNAIEVIEDWQILCFAYKWLGDDGVTVVGQDDFRSYTPGVNNDFMVVAKLWQLFDEADVVIAHNGDSFDQKKAQARMMAHDLTPPSPYKQLDTKKIAKRYAAFTSNKLSDLAKKFGIALKDDPGGFATWKGCMAGDAPSWAKMKEYNRQDVVVLEELYLKLRPWINSHPAMNILDGRPEACPKCGEGPLEKRGTLKINSASSVQRYRCKSCGGWSQSRKNTKSDVQFVN
ncbi:Ribonuclease H-like domain containing protein [uncultured Caudovirales phage]|uniref:Ribonuclease H-like domain containing protein n=1 Tax=uncultured Caudovirales phage TaxID=2100421 RepID=A0A6J5SFI0_9CAUD|nr:Ribonuclease H-like domain containing protein [uncultured Caudovirales phage]CAB4212956.1 Ribonuclease H-like domain containing protein [uncultured Caudovirales phage]